MSDFLPIERRWIAEDSHDPRPNCPNRVAHAVRVYGNRWAEHSDGAFPKLDGKSVARSHKQIRCNGCLRYAIWVCLAGTVKP